jgi:valyl-tRNA synthetase
VNQSLEEYRFHEAANRLYDFFWRELCDWYIELVKPRLAPGAPPEVMKKALFTAMAVFEGALRLLAPFMPFITEELWQALYEGKAPKKSIALAAFPKADVTQMDERAEREMAILQKLIETVREQRATLTVEPRQRTPIRVFAEASVRRIIEENRRALENLAGVETVNFASESLSKLPGARHTADFDVVVEYERKVDVAAERDRLQKEIAKLEKELANAQRQLGNESFLSKAPANVVDGLRKRRAEVQVLLDKGRSALNELGGMQ